MIAIIIILTLKILLHPFSLPSASSCSSHQLRPQGPCQIHSQNGEDWGDVGLGDAGGFM